MRAAKVGRSDLVTSLIDEHGANVNAVADRSLYTALILAAYDNHKDVVKILLARGADPSLRNKFGESALQCVMDAKAKGKNNRDELIKILQA
jgi:ankyrin repeat protein